VETKRTDSKQSPGDGSGSSGVTFLTGESVGGGGRLEENKGEENKDFGPDSSLVGVGVDAECLE
jgi:hypothetical protein